MDKIMANFISKLCSEDTMIKIVLILLKWLAESTENKLDDQMVKVVEEKLLEEME